ncbi:Cancer susceptibility candidate protein 1-like protein, partial [Ophiophagus hannah]
MEWNVFQLIAKLEMYVLETPFDELPSSVVIQYQETIVHLQSLLHHKYNQATEHLLKQPCHGFDLPKPLTTCDVAVRILHTCYDHLSPFQAFPSELPKLDLPSTEAVAQPSEDTDVQNEETLKDVTEIKTEASTRTMVLDTGLETYPYTATCEESEDNSAVTVGITIHLSDSVVYFEEPLIARWDNQEKHWRTDDIGEVIYNMKEKEISFRMNGFFTVSLLQDAHLNMPQDNQCMIYSVATVEDSDLLMGLREKWMTPMSLMIVLKRAGMNIFPAEYSTKYVSVNKKTLLAEIMVYQQMSLVATSFAFGWSKWNLKSGENDLVFKVGMSGCTQNPS